MIKVTLLGTGSQVPSAKRNHTAVLLNYEGESILVDCGEGTQRQFRYAKLNPCKITKLLISHWHGDHVLGIPGVLQTLALSNYSKKLVIYGPKGTKNFMKKMFEVFVFREKFHVEVKEVSNERFFENKDFYLEAKAMSHGIPCNAYCFVKKGQVKIDKDKLKRSGLHPGPLLSKIKQGKNIVYKGKKYKAKDMTYRDNDKKICFVFDTSMNAGIGPFVKDSDLLIMESSFDSSLGDKASEYRHMTAKQCAQVAKKAKSKKLILSHVSSRYDKNPGKILSEAKKIFKNSHLAKDLESFRI
jgi:ribonuclease Z